jgi:hypothetical protein
VFGRSSRTPRHTPTRASRDGSRRVRLSAMLVTAFLEAVSLPLPQNPAACGIPPAARPRTGFVGRRWTAPCPSIQLNACQPSARQPSRCQKRFTSTGLHRIPTPLAGVLQAAQHRFCTCELTARFPSSQVQKWHPARWKTPARRPGDESGLVLVNGCPDHHPFTSTKPARLVPQVIRETTQMNR